MVTNVAEDEGTANDLPPPEQLTQRSMAELKSRVLYAPASLCLANYVPAGPKPAEELPESTGTHAPALLRDGPALE